MQTLTIKGEITPITFNVYTNGTVIVNALRVTGAISPVIVNGSVGTNRCYIALPLEIVLVLSVI